MNKTTTITKQGILPLVHSAVMLALSIALSYFTFSKLPYGGSITPASALPLCFIAVKYGPAWGLGTAFCYSWFQVMQGGVFSWGLTPTMLVGSILLDYVLAFTVLGLAGCFRRYGTRGILGGIAFACGLRFLSSFASGVLIFANFEEFVVFGASFVNRPVLYSLCYNLAYMLPETVICIFVAWYLLKKSEIQKFLGLLQSK